MKSYEELNGSPSADCVADYTSRLRTLAAELETYLTGQLDNLKHVVTQARTSGDDETELWRMIDEFERQKSQWESERHEHVARIQEDTARLTEAWSELEAEQRRILTRQVSMSGSAQQHQVTIANASRAPSTQHVGNEYIPMGSGNQPMPPYPAPQSANPNERAVSQFQQMRREMRKHSRRNQ